MSTGNGPEMGETTTTYDEAVEAGYWGTHPDPAGNDPYTLEGVASAPPIEEGGEASKSKSSSSGTSKSSGSSSSKSDS